MSGPISPERATAPRFFSLSLSSDPTGRLATPGTSPLTRSFPPRSFQTMIDPEFADNYGGKKRDRPVGGLGGGGGGGGMGGGGGGGRGFGSNIHGTGRIRGMDHSAPMAGG